MEKLNKTEFEAKEYHHLSSS